MSDEEETSTGDNDAEQEMRLDEMLSGRALPRFAMPEVATLFEFGIESDENGDPVVTPFDLSEDPLLKELADSLPVSARGLKLLPDRPPHSQSGDWGMVLGAIAAIWQLAGLPGAIQTGQRVRAWLRARKGRSGDVGALLPVALYHLTREFPDAKPDPSRVQYFNPVQRRGYPLDHQVVFLFRFYDLSDAIVYVVEVDSLGDCVTCIKRPGRMFETSGNMEAER